MRDAGRVLADLEEFIAGHRSHGTPTCDATEPAWNGYLLTVACPCADLTSWSAVEANRN